MAAPTLQAEAASLTIVTSGACAPTIPAHATDDILLATVMVYVPATAGTIFDIPTPANWTKLGSVDITGATKDGQFAWFWRRAPSSGTTVSFARGTIAPGTTAWDTGTDGQYSARVDVIRGCATSGDPFDAFAMSAELFAANGNTPAVTVSGSERTVMFFEAHTTDTASAHFTARTNFTMGTHQGATTGTGGGMRNARRVNVSSSESATATTHTANTSPRSYAFGGISFKPVTPTATAVGEVSLASGSTPDVNTGHELHVRARKSAGTGTVTLKAALYESTNNRSGDLETSALTTSLAEYTLAIPEASAANISSYSNLGVRFWGASSSGDTVNVEIADLWLEIPEPAGPATVSGTAALSGAGALTSSGARVPITVSGSSALSGAGALTSSGKRVSSGSAALSGAGALTASGNVIAEVISGSAVLTGSGALTASGIGYVFGAAALSGAGALVASGKHIVSGSAALGGSGALAASGHAVVAITGTATLSGAGALAASGGRVSSGSAALTASGNLSASGVKVKLGSAALSGSGALTAAGKHVVSGSVTLSGAGSGTGTGQRTTAGSAALSANGALTASGRRLRLGSAALSGSGVVTAAGKRVSSGSAALAGAGALVLTGRKTTSGSAALTGLGALVAAGNVSGAPIVGIATLTGSGALAASGTHVVRGQSALAASGTLVSSGIRFGAVSGQAALTGSGTLSASGVRVCFGVGALAGVGTLAAAGTHTATGEALLIGLGLLSAHGGTPDSLLYGPVPPIPKAGSRVEAARAGDRGTLVV